MHYLDFINYNTEIKLNINIYTIVDHDGVFFRRRLHPPFTILHIIYNKIKINHLNCFNLKSLIYLEILQDCSRWGLFTTTQYDELKTNSEKLLYIISATVYKSFMDTLFNDKWTAERSRWIYLVFMHSYII